KARLGCITQVRGGRVYRNAELPSKQSAQPQRRNADRGRGRSGALVQAAQSIHKFQRGQARRRGGNKYGPAPAAEGPKNGQSQNSQLEAAPGQRSFSYIAPERAALAVKIFIPINFVGCPGLPISNRVQKERKVVFAGDSGVGERRRARPPQN